MVLDLVVCHNLSPEWLVTRPIDVFLDIFERHIESLMTASTMPFMPSMARVSDNPVKTWKEGNFRMTKTNLLQNADMPKGEGLKSSKSTLF